VGLRRVCHNGAVACGWLACVGRSAQASTGERPGAHLQSDAVLVPALVNGRCVVFHLDNSGILRCDVTIVEATRPCYLGKSDSVLLRDAEQAKTRKHVLNGTVKISHVMHTFG
jgi:hypothetical protein